MAVKRNRRLSMLISDEEWEMLQALAEQAGITASDWVRMRIRIMFEAERPRLKAKKR